MKDGLKYSGILHTIVILLAIFGLPSIFKKDEVITLSPIPVEVVDVSENTTSPKPSPLPKPDKPEEKPEEKPPLPPESVPEKPSEPEPEPEPEPEVKPEPPKPEPEPELEVKPEPTPEPLPKPEIKEKTPPKPPVKPKIKEPKEKKPEKKKDDKDKKKDEPSADFASVLKNLQKSNPQQESSGIQTLGDTLSMSEMDALRKQMAECWNMPAGLINAGHLVVDVRITVNPDATVAKAELVDNSGAKGHPQYRVAADSALRAVLNPRCSPLRLPLDKYEQWKVFTFRFDPREMM